MNSEIKQVCYPNTVADLDKTICMASRGYSFKIIKKCGEAVLINWVMIYKDGRPYARIRESVCDIYYA